jgi:hypothetical protein
VQVQQPRDLLTVVSAQPSFEHTVDLSDPLKYAPYGPDTEFAAWSSPYADYAASAHPMHAPHGQPAFTPDIATFTLNLVTAVGCSADGPLFEKMAELNARAGRTVVVLAGGSVFIAAMAGTSAATGRIRAGGISTSHDKIKGPVWMPGCVKSDFDFFTIDCTLEERRRIFLELASVVNVDTISCWIRNAGTCTAVRPGMADLQFVMDAAPTVYDLLECFDTTPSKFASDGVQVVCTQAALHSAITRTFFLNFPCKGIQLDIRYDATRVRPLSQAPHTPLHSRVLKLAPRRGMRVCLPNRGEAYNGPDGAERLARIAAVQDDLVRGIALHQAELHTADTSLNAVDDTQVVLDAIGRAYRKECYDHDDSLVPDRYNGVTKVPCFEGHDGTNGRLLDAVRHVRKGKFSPQPAKRLQFCARSSPVLTHHAYT